MVFKKSLEEHFSDAYIKPIHTGHFQMKALKHIVLTKGEFVYLYINSWAIILIISLMRKRFVAIVFDFKKLHRIKYMHGALTIRHLKSITKIV